MQICRSFAVMIACALASTTLSAQVAPRSIDKNVPTPLRTRFVTGTVVILAPDEADRRLVAAREALEFWNQTLVDAGVPIRLTAKVVIASPLSPALERLLKASIGPTPPPELAELPGDVILFLSQNEQLISVTRQFGSGRALVALRSDSVPPLNLPNVARNVVAHEMGHALGLLHNSDPRTLMCGRPADCRPALFQSETSRFFPLTTEDRENLQRLSDTAGK